MAREEEFETRLLRHLTSMLESQRGLNNKFADAIERTSSFDKEIAKLTRLFFTLKEEMIDVRSEISGLKIDLGAVRSDIAGVKADVSGVKADISGVKAELSSFRAETAERLGALSIRIDEVETGLERNSDLLRETRIEAVSHYNEILNAVQAGTVNGADIRDLDARVQSLERRMAP